VQADETLSFQWQNDDWQFSPPDLRSKWERVAAVVDYVLSLTEKKTPPKKVTPKRRGL